MGLGRIETQTDDQGQFHLTGVPVGAIHLIADGTTAMIPGTWPTLEFEVNTISGRDNTVGMPIYLLPIDVQNSQTVSPTQSASLQVSNVPGFSLDIAPGSVTFRDGSQTGSVSVTQVHRDKVPMPPPNGLNPKIVFTIQPPGSVFDPPAPISYPNVDNRLPGEIVDLYSFDHDLGQWVGIGTGTVSQDGAYIQSDPEVGIIEGGWHFAAPRANTNQTNVVGNIECNLPTNLNQDNVNEWVEKALEFLGKMETKNKVTIDQMLIIIKDLNLKYEATRDKQFCGNTDPFTTTNGCFAPNDPDGPTITLRFGDDRNNAQVMLTFVHELFHAWNYKSLQGGLNKDGTSVENGGTGDIGDEIADNIEELLGIDPGHVSKNTEDDHEGDDGTIFDGEAHKFASKFAPKCK